MSELIVKIRKLEEIYREWRGNKSCYDNGRPIFEADELLDFAQFCLNHEANGVTTEERQLTIPDVIGRSTPKPPEPPLSRVLQEGVRHFCINCGSTASRNGFLGLFGEMLCHNQKCPNSKSKKNYR